MKEDYGFLDIQSKLSELHQLKEDMLPYKNNVTDIRYKQLYDYYLELLNLNEALYERCAYDGLTGIYSRRYIMDELNRQLVAHKSKEATITVILLDLDDFKSINDQFGHPIGDKVLVRTARTLERQLRKKDVIGRYGGEEFLILLPDTDIREGYVIADRLRMHLEAFSRDFNEETIPVTASFGVISVKVTSKHDVHKVIDRADKALYAAKERGKNLVHIAEDSCGTAI